MPGGRGRQAGATGEGLTSRRVPAVSGTGSAAPEPMAAWYSGPGPVGQAAGWLALLSSVAKGSPPFPVCLEQNGSGNTVEHPCETV